MLSIQEALRQMQEAVHIGSGVDPMRVGVWMIVIEAAMRDKDEELDFLRSVKESRGRELDEKDAEIERLREALQAFKDFDDLPMEAKRPDVFDLKVRRPILKALAGKDGK